MIGKYKILFFLFTFVMRECAAQNLVNNGSFEIYTGCPTNFSQIDSALYWTTPTSASSSDLYHHCASSSSGVGVPSSGTGYQQPFEGEGYSGLYLIFPPSENYREYIEVPLTQTLTSGSCYYFSMYVNLTNTCQYSTNAIQVYLSDTAITNVMSFTPLPFTPQIINNGGSLFDTLSWTLVSGEYIASGNEGYLIIGNFYDDAGSNLTLVNPDAVFEFVYVLIDFVSLTPCKPNVIENPVSSLLKIYPQPADDFVIISLPSPDLDYSIQVLDMLGNEAMQYAGHSSGNSVELDTRKLINGIYWLLVNSNTGNYQTILLVQ